MQVRYEIVDAYPLFGSDAFRPYSSAAIGCWLREDLLASDEDAKDHVRGRIRDAGWGVAKSVRVEQVSDETYANKSSGRDMFEQSKTDGYVAMFHLRRRELLGNRFAANRILRDYVSIVNTLQDKGAFIFTNGGDLAKTLTPDGDEFVPIWTSLPSDNSPLGLRQYTAKLSPPSDLLDALRIMIDRDLYCGLGQGDGLVVCHPGDLAVRIE